MAIGTSSSLTQEFVDLLSGELLRAPDPQWVFASLADAARMDAMSIPDMAGRSGIGGFTDAMNRAAGSIDRMGGLAGKGFAKIVMDPSTPGKVILIDRPAYLGGAFTEVSRRVTEGTAIDTSAPVPPTMGQVSLTVRRYAGPTKADGSALTPLAVTDFLKRRAKHDLVEYMGMLLRRDRNKFVDSVIGNLLLTTTNQTIADGNGPGAEIVGSNPLTAETLATIKRKLLERNVPTFPNGNYLAVLHPRHEENLRADPLFREVSRYLGTAENRGPLLSGYLTSFGGFDICLSNNIATATAGSGGSVTAYQGLFFGPEAIGWGIGMEAHVRRSNNDDFGQADYLVWLADECWGLLNADFVEKVLTT